MKLFIWNKVLRDYCWGTAFAMAESTDQARQLILDKYTADRIAIDQLDASVDQLRIDIAAEPDITSERPCAGYLQGSC